MATIGSNRFEGVPVPLVVGRRYFILHGDNPQGRKLIRLMAMTALALLAGCVTSQFTPIAEAETEGGVSVLYDYPTAPYRKLGLIDLDYYKPGWRTPTVTDAFPKLKAKVREVGGNAFIIRGQRAGQVQSRSIIVSAEVLTVQWPAKHSP